MQGILATKFLKTWPELVSEYSFKRKNQAVTLASKSAVKINGESIQVDPFWAADPKGTMFYRTEGGISVRPNERPNERLNKRTSDRPVP